ncbi:hypothetical protein [Chishuiella sp.]|uniref:hypothetical protein n=1 Tax=Chishuiella sp. TaxID=1969467 RepID=UPI0028ADB284|nr:hypothetical protein [Chishuiella sp.]
MPLNILQATKNYIQHINQLNKKLLDYSEDIKFNSIDLTESIKTGKLNPEIGMLENCIYFIQLNNIKNSDVETICEHITNLKTEDKTTKYPRVNGNIGNGLNNILYIGKSKGKLQSRFNSHLKPTPKGTYGLHLENWHEQFKHIEFKLYYASVDLCEEDKDTDILEILESGLHLQVKPLLGRSGH